MLKLIFLTSTIATAVAYWLYRLGEDWRDGQYIEDYEERHRRYNAIRVEGYSSVRIETSAGIVFLQTSPGGEGDVERRVAFDRKGALIGSKPGLLPLILGSNLAFGIALLVGMETVAFNKARCPSPDPSTCERMTERSVFPSQLFGNSSPISR
jgi:hypothetical protein